MFFGGGMLLFWLLIAALVVAVTGNTERVTTWLRHPKASHGQLLSAPETPMEILRRRYARGDISREEFLETKQTLEKDS